MSEPQPHDNHNWDLMRARLDGLRIRARFAAESAVHEVKYRSATSDQEQERGSLMAEVFTGEAMNFLNYNLTAKLSPLNPTREQVGIFQLLMESIDDGSLILQGTEGRMWSNNRPFVIKKYQVGERFNAGGDLGSSLTEMFEGKDVHLTTRWGVREPFPHGFAVFGSIGMAMPRRIDFMTLPKKAGSPEEVRKLLGIEEQQSGFTHQVGVYNNGKRIIIDRYGVYRRKNVSMTDQYYLVGTFDGEGTQKTYWLYGSNGGIHHKMSVSQMVGVAKTVTQTSGNK